MGSVGGPNIVKEGLVLNLDASNIKSFRGEPTTNIFPRSSTTLAFTSAYDGSNYGFGSATNIQQEFDDSLRPKSKSRITKVSRINSGVNQRTYVHVGLHSPLSSVRVVSFWYYGTYGSTIRPYNNDGSASLSYLDSNGTWVGSGTGINIPVSTNQWQKISIRITNNGTSAGTGWSWLILHNNNHPVVLPNTDYWAFSEFMYEEKDFPSYFYTSDTRGSTVATGGGWVDLSGNNNHGELVNDPTFDSDNLGSIQFDGVDDYVVCNPPNITGYPFTLSCQCLPLNSNRQIAVSLHSGSSAYFGIGTIGGRWSIEARPSQNIFTSSTDVILERWANLVCIFISETERVLLLNGNVIGTDTRLTTFNSFSEFFVGRQRFQTAGHGSLFFNGNISQVQIYNRALTPEEVMQNFKATKSRFGL